MFRTHPTRFTICSDPTQRDSQLVQNPSNETHNLFRTHPTTLNPPNKQPTTTCSQPATACQPQLVRAEPIQATGIHNLYTTQLEPIHTHTTWTHPTALEPIHPTATCTNPSNSQPHRNLYPPINRIVHSRPPPEPLHPHLEPLHTRLHNLNPCIHNLNPCIHDFTT